MPLDVARLGTECQQGYIPASKLDGAAPEYVSDAVSETVAHSAVFDVVISDPSDAVSNAVASEPATNIYDGDGGRRDSAQHLSANVHSSNLGFICPRECLYGPTVGTAQLFGSCGLQRNYSLDG